MRVKVHTLAPLPERKVLVPLPDTLTIAQLAERVCTSVLRPTLGTAVPAPADLTLEIDGFQLLEDSPVTVLEPNDVITVRLRPGSSKRPAAAAVATDVPATKRSRLGAVRGEEDMLIDTESSSEEESSPSESESSSDSESSSESESSSSAPSTSLSSARSPTAPAFPVFKPVAVVTATPPFQGKPSTHERNARRRRAKQMKKLAADAFAAGLSFPPLGTPAVVANGAVGVSSGPGSRTTTPTTQLLPVPRKMENRNKKKGFLQEMLNVQGTKTVFHDSDESGSAPHPAVPPPSLGSSRPPTPRAAASPAPALLPASPAAPAAPHRSPSPPPTPVRMPEVTRAYLVPPSERTNLPSNVFVTSREFEFMTDNERRKRDAAEAAAAGGEPQRKGRRQRECQGTKQGGSTTKDQQQPQLQIQENAAAAAATSPATGLGSMSPDRLLAHVQTAYDTLPLLDPASAVPGALIAWKDVVLDMQTFSPQIRVCLARVLPSGAEEGKVLIEHVRDPLELAEDNGEDGEEGPLREVVGFEGREYRAVQ